MRVQRPLSQAWENRRPGKGQCLWQSGYWPGLVALGRRKWQPTPLLLPGGSPGQRSLVGYTPWSRRVRHNWVTDTHTHTHSCSGSHSLSQVLSHFRGTVGEMATHSSVLVWRIPGTREPGGLPSMGLHRVRHYWSNLAAAAAAGEQIALP